MAGIALVGQSRAGNNTQHAFSISIAPPPRIVRGFAREHVELGLIRGYTRGGRKIIEVNSGPANLSVHVPLLHFVRGQRLAHPRWIARLYTFLYMASDCVY